MTGVIRTRKDGGCSICRASEENVGKRRCNHVLDNAEIKIRKDGATKFVDISGKINNNNEKFSIKTSEEQIKKYISNLSKGLSKKQKDDILNTLRNER